MAEHDNPTLVETALQGQRHVKQTGRQAVCRKCWDGWRGGRKPLRVIPVQVETCCVCHEPTTAGLYVRIGP